MQSLPLRRLVSGRPPEPDRIFFTSIWFKGHNNPRYAELLPRLERLDRYLSVCSDDRLAEASSSGPTGNPPVRNPLVCRSPAGATRHVHRRQRADPGFPGPMVSDVDDPVFSEREVEQLNDPNLKAYVVTAERAAAVTRSSASTSRPRDPAGHQPRTVDPG